MSVNDYLERARRHEDQESWGEALYLYERAIQGLEEEGNPDPELFSRAGDLQLRLKRPKEAAASYDKAIDLYVSRTNLDGAFAVCQKVLRHLPDLSLQPQRSRTKFPASSASLLSRAARAAWASQLAR